MIKKIPFQFFCGFFPENIVLFGIFGIFKVLEEFWRGLEDLRSDRIYSSGNQGVKKGPGPQGTRDEEFLVPSLIGSVVYE